MNDQSHTPHRVRFGTFEVDLATGELWKSGRKLKLTGQPFSVLAILLERPGEVISREQFQRRLWPDTFVDVDHNLNTAINKIRETLGDSKERPRFVETLSRRGYRFIASIESSDQQTKTTDAAQDSGKRLKNSVPAGAEDGFWIALLPFKLSDADTDLADAAMALIEEIVTGLSRFSYLRVISLSSTSQYAGKPVDVRAAGKELGARYVIEGSLRHAGPRVRIAAQLVDCNSGAHLAAAQRAVEGAPSNHLACHALASVEFFRKQLGAFQIATARAVALNPMDGFTLAYLGFLTAYAGDWERGGALSAKARGLNPHHPGWYWFVPCFDAYRKGEYKTSLEFAREVNLRGFWRTQLAIAASCGQLGQQTAASEALQALLMQRPDIGKFPREELAIWWQPDMVEHLITGLRKAGLEV